MKLNRMVIALGITMAGVAALTATSARSLADSNHPIEPIDLVPVTVETPQAIADPRPVIVTEHDLDEKSVEKLARLLWSSPLRNEWYKKQLVWVVMNRAAYGEPFDSTICECINEHEFAFFDSHAHRSQENLRIVREAMNEWYSREEGNNPGVTIPRFAFYIRFEGTDNRHMEVLDINKNVIS